MRVDKFLDCLDIDFYCGVPDSQLKALCDYLLQKYGVNNKNHVIAANEGNCAAIASGYHLATGKTALVYMQNSGQGNIVNPVASLLNEKVYGIPCVFVIGWRGEPEVHDEPQHVFQGEVTLAILETLHIPYFVVGGKTTPEEIKYKFEAFKDILKNGKQVAFVVKKGALTFEQKKQKSNAYNILREDAIRSIVNVSDGDIIVSTTGKISRELFEIREEQSDHNNDFLTVGSMGHSSSIALGIALQKKDKRVWILDGDGALIMHMGAMAVIGNIALPNMIHIVLNNEAHESVGGQPTSAQSMDMVGMANSCGYKYCASVNSSEELNRVLNRAKALNVLSFIEVKCALGVRENLGRPTSSAKENKENFMKNLLK